MTRMQRLRRWLARALDPDVELTERKLFNLRNQISTAHRWLGEFKEISAVTEWLMIGEANYWRTQDQKPVETKWQQSITAFREQLRRNEHYPPPLKPELKPVERVDVTQQPPFQSGGFVPGDDPEQAR